MKKDIKSGVPQCLILGPLLFLFYVNHLLNSWNVLVPIMFVSFKHSNIGTLDNAVNYKLININEWLSADKLFLNVGKNNFSLLHKSGKKQGIPSSLRMLKMENHDIERVNTLKFLSVVSDENLSWKVHIKYLENKITKNINFMNSCTGKNSF